MRIEIDSAYRVVQWSVDDTKNELLFYVDDKIVPSDFEENAFYYYYKDGKFVLDKSYKERREKEFSLLRLRQARHDICFPIINRGALWYDSLSNEQKEELKAWYNAWLNVTETFIEPEMPDWLERMM